MSGSITIFGHGAVGRAAVDLLSRAGRDVRVAQRHAPADLPPGVSFQGCDVLDGESVLAATRGASDILVAVGFAYEGKVWRVAWPKAMTNFLDACEATAARMIFIDNLYMYGPQREPLREDMPLTTFGVKPAARAAATRLWMAASEAGRVRVAALRSPDFYGPGVTLSHLGEVGFARLAKGKAATLIAPPDTPHDFAYVPDIARAAATLLDAPDDAFGQAWHSPCAPTQTPRQILALGAAALGVKLRLNALPLALLPPLGLVSPFMREMAEMRFQWDRPYQVDWRKFARRFWSDATSFEQGAKATALSFCASAAPKQGASKSTLDGQVRDGLR
ncbi:MAG TPA: NAD-dependent epimerase/dehydratase family protein [Micropepsaceae bacterium]|jgi:nucleoside-diphosphate-sugar epimerase|nr:NAD-dependent epimerase/dehydratase family protein [Micropepsaceae bacterium]